METWREESIEGGENLAELKIQNRIFQENRYYYL